jgi:F0F1-type ATP synthase assembly protein I
VIAYAWASRITTVSLEMVLPGAGGHWLDRRLGTLPVFTVIGFTFGLILGIWHLLKMTSAQSGNNRSGNTQSKPTHHDGPPREK